MKQIFYSDAVMAWKKEGGEENGVHVRLGEQKSWIYQIGIVSHSVYRIRNWFVFNSKCKHNEIHNRTHRIHAATCMNKQTSNRTNTNGSNGID